MKTPRPLPHLVRPFDAELVLPGSKSEANRALVLAALAQGITRLEGATLGDDVLYLAEGLMALGFEVGIVDPSAGLIDVVGGIPNVEDEAEIYCGNAGTVLRFLVSVAALVPGEWRLTGDARLRERPIAPLLDAWRSLGVVIRDCEGGLPVTIMGGRRKGGRVRLPSELSSQFLSSLLLVGHALEGGLEVEVPGSLASPDYVTLTIEAMARFGLRVHREGSLHRVSAARPTSPGPLEIEGDWSAAGAFLVLAELAHGRFQGRNLRPQSRQADRRLPEVVATLRAEGDLVVDLARMPDQLMNLAVLAAHRPGETRFVGAANLRLKECDRLAVTARELRRAGVEVEEHDDGLVVRGRAELEPVVFDPEHDHRVAMALAVIGALTPGCSMHDRRCVGKSYPAFFDQLRELAESHRALVLVGMRGSGKTRLARELGPRLGSPVVDTDEIFVKREGAIAEFVARQGWPAFRRIEAGIVAENLAPRRVLALGGGALEDETTRALVRERGIVIHLDEDLELIRERLRKDADRPALTAAGTLEELEEIHARRADDYRRTAHLRVPPGLTTEAQADHVIAELRRLCTW